MEEKLHVVMLPWIAFGHMIPFFQLSVALAKAGIKVSFASTPGNIKRLPAVPPAYRNDEAVGVFEGFYGENASGITDGERVSRILNGCQAYAVRSCAEFEGDYLKLSERLTGKPVIPVGLLPREKPERKQFTDGRWGEIFKWLDDQKPRSVVFVGFGSECKLTKDQVYEIAHGVELSGLPFLWALRKPGWANDDRDALPSGFGERTSDRGIVCTGWAPQLEILGHPSIGGSLFHSGWGSIIEILQFGHTLILLPFIIDQPLNARYVVEKGLGVEIEREEDGSFTRDGVEKALKLAMVSVEGKSQREKASEAGAIFGNLKLHQDYYIGKFVDFLKEEKRNV
ncbi:hypothetical protein OIU77_010386 [Salix suchowensis]|uniref:Uncharacterized protein n=1 Tax=Salix suchowensis TaxID=1278906 RepID=A0ABQ9A856_9ROSI|nr:hypothetical protein OIU77_010386 [Salix suchowensis]